MDFERVRETFGVVVTDVIDLRDVAHVSWYGLPELAWGYRLGIVTAALATSISLDRYRSGDRLEPNQEEIALALASQSAEVEDALSSAADRLTDDAGIERFWLYIVMASIAATPERALPHGRTAALRDALMYWPDEVAVGWQPPRPRWFRSRDAVEQAFIARRIEESRSRYLSPRDNRDASTRVADVAASDTYLGRLVAELLALGVAASDITVPGLIGPINPDAMAVLFHHGARRGASFEIFASPDLAHLSVEDAFADDFDATQFGELRALVLQIVTRGCAVVTVGRYVRRNRFVGGGDVRDDAQVVRRWPAWLPAETGDAV